MLRHKRSAGVFCIRLQRLCFSKWKRCYEFFQIAPWSSFVSGINASPEKTVGIPITRPENVAVPPRYSAYWSEEDTIIKNDICGYATQ